MYAVELDRSKRLLVISAAQTVTAEEAKMAAQRIREALQDVAPGFRVLADFRGLQSMDSAAARHIAEIMDALAEKEVASVTRVMPDPHKDIGLNILSHSVRTGRHYHHLRYIGRCGAKYRSQSRFSLGLMPLGSSFVSSLNRFGFGHVFAFLRGPVEREPSL
jgi:anti-anti-sigma regulatory factor